MANIIELSKKINNICRICLKQGDEMSPIFGDNINTSNLTVLADKITSIAPVEVSPTDGLPTSICKICRKQVDQFHEFRLLVEISDRTLRSCIKNEEVEIKNEASDEEKSDSENQCEELPMVISETQDKDPANYALLVSTSSGLQLWKISDLEENQLLDKVKNDSTVPTKKLPQVKIPIDSNPKIIISKPSDESIRFRQYSDTNNDRIVRKEKNNSDEFSKADTNCELCSKTFGSLEELKNHISEHCFENESEDSPDPLFFQKSQMDFHETVEHDDEFGNESIEFFIQEDDENSSKKVTDGCYEKKGLKVKRKVGQILFKCNKCEKVFPKTYLKKHLEKCRRREPSPLDCNECGKQFLKKSELRYHKGTHLSSPLSCNECENKTFRNIQSYKMHMKRHTLGSRYNCNTCEKSYYTNSELARHVQQHLGRRKFPCHLCDTSFLSKPELNRHLKYHNGVKRFECHLCYKSYYESGHLKVHLRVHTGERPFVCPTCNKGFVTRSKLVRHSKTHK